MVPPRQFAGHPWSSCEKVDCLRFISIDCQFARVAVRYHGQRSHDEILDSLQTEYGPIERLPGSMIRGLSQPFTAAQWGQQPSGVSS